MDGSAVTSTGVEISLGFTFFFPNDDHLWFVATSVNDPSLVAMNFTSVTRFSDTSFMIDDGDHPWVTHKTTIAWSKAIVTTLDRIQRGVFTGELEPHTPLSQPLILKVWTAADRMQFSMPEKCREIFIKQDLIMAL